MTEHLVNMLYMRSDPSTPRGDLTAKATIRNAALRLFADRGPDAVTVREVAIAAAVSPALVMHHFGSKAGLHAAVDEYVAHSFDAVLDALTEDELGDALTGGDSTSLAEAFVAALPPGSPLPDYLRRLLLTNDPTGDRVFARWFAECVRVLVSLEEAGIARPSKDRRVRAAFLLVNDLATVLLARQLRDAVGIDVQTPAGMAVWSSEAVDVYAQGAFRARDKGES
ncbi:MAG TPA: TetR family transcriptional regulator [Nocardioides sp.]|nr:TetR family transcriptional regulator [Nocardioides sp.]